MNRKTKNLIILLGVVLILVCVGTAAILLIPDSKSSDMYTEKLTVAQKYLKSENYDYAIKYFEEAIEINPDDEKAYRQLGQVYIEMGNYDKAVSVFQEGYKATKSKDLDVLINRYLPYLENDSTAEASQDTTVGNGEKDEIVRLNTNLLTQLSNYDFEDYEGEYGSASYTQSYGTCQVVHSSLNAQFVYMNDDEYVEALDSDGYPVDGAIPTTVSFNDVSDLFSQWNDSGISYSELQQMGLNGLRIQQLDGMNIVQFNYSKCTVKIQCDQSGNITEKTAWNSISPEQQLREETDTHSFVVDIIESSTGGHISTDYVVQIAKADDVVSSDNQILGSADNIVEEITTQNGVLDLELEYDDYVVCVYPASDSSSFRRYNWTIDENTTANDLKIVVTPTLSEDEIVIVLKWGETPRDLDSHIVGEGIHVWFANKESGNVTLDVDCTQGNGIETITVNGIDGDYTYYVDNYSEEEPMGINSGATVEVFVGGSSSPRVFSVPSEMDDIWEVFTISNGEITEVNTEADTIY